MTQGKDKYADDLNQIRDRAAGLIDEIDAIKDRHTGRELAEIEQIQNKQIATVAEIDQIMAREGLAPEGNQR